MARGIWLADLILGLDPGSRHTGYGVVAVDRDRVTHVAHGVIHLRENWAFAERLRVLHLELAALFERFAVHTTVVEKIFFGKNADSAFKLGHARGVCLLAAAQAGVPLEEYAARFVKKSVTGSGAASKEHVQMLVMAAIGLKSSASLELDASDALALALTHARLRDVNLRMKRAMEGNV